MNVGRLTAICCGLLLAGSAACVGPYAERPSTERPSTELPSTGPPADTEEATAPPEAVRPGDGSFRGYVAPDGTVHPDTLAPADPPVERATVLTGVLAAPVPAATPAPAPASGTFAVQVYAAREREAAEGVAERVGGQFPEHPVRVVSEPPWHKVRVGRLTSREEADRLGQILSSRGYDGAWVVAAP